MKDECAGQPIVEFVGLRPKMYSYRVLDDDKPHIRAKGIAKAAQRELRHQDYLDQLQLPHENYLPNRRIAQKLHKLHSVEVQKRGLCAFDDKRFLLGDGTTLVTNCYSYLTYYF